MESVGSHFANKLNDIQYVYMLFEQIYKMCIELFIKTEYF